MGLVYLLLVLLYFIPAVVAGVRHVPHEGSIVVVNIFLGWTLVGWVVALAMACRTIPPHPALPPPGAPSPGTHAAPSPPQPPPVRWPYTDPGYRRLP
jgi:hypothetical protein